MAWKVISVCVLIMAVGIALMLTGAFHAPPESPAYGDGWWGKGVKPNKQPDESIMPFKVNVEQSVLKDLMSRIRHARFSEGLENSKFHYGVRPEYMRVVAKYWLNNYNWTKHQEEINKFDHFKTNIEGLNIHFVHIKPKLKPGQKAIPLMMVHGWPGSFYEFLKVASILTDSDKSNIVFEVICPSIPGYTFSEASHKKGLNGVAVARMFDKLMKRLGFDKYYIQGGDWGSHINTKLSLIAPDSILGLHLNFVVSRIPLQGLLLAVGSYFPGLVLSSKEDQDKVFPVGEKFADMLLETGYMHIQATKPDTLGHALDDSPIGLAAYILEKFSTGTDKNNRNKDDGGITEVFNLDDVLTNIMLYWITGSMTTAMRLYKESIDLLEPMYEVKVPSAFADFPNEFSRPPEPWVRKQYVNLVQFSVMPRGGHFAALEEPELLANDVRKFVETLESNRGKS